MRSLRLPVVLVCAATVVAMLAGPAAARPPVTAKPVSEWVSGVCGSLGNWKDSIQADVDKTDSNASKQLRRLKGKARVEKGKKIIVDLLDRVIKLSKRTETDLRGLGDPDVGEGAAVHQALGDGFHQVVKLFESFKRKVQAVSTGDAKKAEQKLTAITDQFSSQGADVERAMNEAVQRDTTGAVSAAIQQDAKCQSVSTTTSTP